jgi:hypothetical protein
MTSPTLELASGLWNPGLAYAWPALLLTVIGLILRHASRNPKTPRGDVVVLDLGYGLVAVMATVLWLHVFLVTVF